MINDMAPVAIKPASAPLTLLNTLPPCPNF
jgi:hypothetical protein